MNKDNILKLMKRAEVIPRLEYDDNLFKFRENVNSTIKAVRKRLEALEELVMEIEFEMSLYHLDEEDEEEFI